MMQFEKIPNWFGKPFTAAEPACLRQHAENANRGMIGKPLAESKKAD